MTAISPLAIRIAGDFIILAMAAAALVGYWVAGVYLVVRFLCNDWGGRRGSMRRVLIGIALALGLGWLTATLAIVIIGGARP